MKRDCGDGLGGAGALTCPTGDNVGGLVAGDAYLATVAYLIPGKVGIGQFQPYVRYQQFERDFGVHYVMEGCNARISATYSKLKDLLASTVKRDQFVIGLQLKY